MSKVFNWNLSKFWLASFCKDLYSVFVICQSPEWGHFGNNLRFLSAAKLSGLYRLSDCTFFVAVVVMTNLNLPAPVHIFILGISIECQRDRGDWCMSLSWDI